MQKERLKKLRTQLDVLSLSATPIPRTLHMAVGGIRDMSVIQTPPEERQPIKTYVTADDDELIKEAVGRELQRGWQVYYLHNRVRTIQKAAERVRRLLPEARIAVGHGQMSEDELASVMVDFEAGKYDVLVCTTIIESGLDIPNVNTILVERSDRFGLAQLYQLRGRVGRSGRRAYAYFLYDPRRSLTEQADKRLDVISGLHELGQGFKIALRDLEIRGAGNLLGTEQHGAIAAVGFEMYLQMLQSAVSRLRTGSEETAVGDVLSTAEMNLDLPLDHFIPRSYIRDEKLRLGAYRQLANAEDEEELDSILRSLKDRYGPAPDQLDNLAYSLRVKLRGQRMGLRAVIAEGHDIVIRVDPQRFLDVEELSRRMAGRIAVGPNRIKMRRKGEGWQADLLSLLDEMAQLYESGRTAAVPSSSYNQIGMEKPYSDGIAAIFEVVHRLRAPGGCPWDREQTHESLRPYLLEETYELLEAIDSGDDAKMMEELGDLLLQVAMHAEIAAEEGRFDTEQVAEAVAAKMVKRHPHVFGDRSVANAEEVLRNWEHQKMDESRKAGSEDSVVDRVPSTLPALAWALGLQKRAARVGLDFPSPAAAAESAAEEARGLAELNDHDRAFEEMGDLLFAIVSLARSLKVNPEDALRVAGQRFRRRFAAAESSLRREGKKFSDLEADELVRRWEESR